MMGLLSGGDLGPYGRGRERTLADFEDRLLQDLVTGREHGARDEAPHDPRG